MLLKSYGALTTAILLISAQVAVGKTKDETKNLQLRPNIVGGVIAEKGELPFQVSLQNSSGAHLCGGSLIKKNWVLTASHCVSNWVSSNNVVIGMQNQKDRTDTETFTALKVLKHPEFSSMTFDYDYALIQLSGDSKFQTIDLNTTEIDIPEIDQAPLNVWTSGWGALAENEHALPDLLNKVEVPLVTAKSCNAASAYNGEVTERMICAGLPQGGKDSCYGDSGGPLYIKQTSGNFLLVGIVSWGEGCARPDKFGVYSKVNVVVDWVAAETQ